MATPIERQTMRKVYLAVLAVLLHSLFHLLSRPREYRLRGADDEQGSRPQLLYLRARRRRLLLGLFPVRGAEQSHPGAGRRARLDRPHHGHLGPGFGRLRVHQRAVSFLILRFLLGLAEAGFFPGMILYFTYWFPPLHRARIVAGFMAAIPVSIGARRAGLDGACSSSIGVFGRRRLAVAVPRARRSPAVIFGIVVLFYLTDRPAQARLAQRRGEGLAGDGDGKETRDGRARSRTISVLQTLFNPRVLALAAIHFAPGRRQRRASRCSPRRSSSSLA